MSVASSAPPTGERPWASVPAEVGALLRPGLTEVVDAVIAAVRAEVPEYDRPLEGEFARQISQGVSVALGQFVDLLGHDSELGDLGVAEALGRAEHRAGRTLDALQSAYRVGARVSWRHVAGLGERHAVDPRVLYRCAEAIFAYIDRIAAASVAGFTQEEAVQAGSVQARRHALLELLARPEPAARVDVERAAARAGFTPPAHVAALAVGEADAVALARRMPDGTIGAALQPVAVLLVADPEGPGRAAQVSRALEPLPGVLGPTVPWPDARASVLRAWAAWPLHAGGALGDAHLVRADEHLLALLLHADPRLRADLLRARLAPLQAMTPAGRARAAGTLRAWLDAHGDVPAAAAALHVHPQTVRYRLAGLRTAFAGALEDPVARLEVSLALRAADYAASAPSESSEVDAPPAPGSPEAEAASPPPPGTA